MCYSKLNCATCMWSETTFYEICSRRPDKRAIISFQKMMWWSSLTKRRVAQTLLMKKVQGQTTLLLQFCCKQYCQENVNGSFRRLLPTSSICNPGSCQLGPALALFQNISRNQTRRRHLWLLSFQCEIKVTLVQTNIAYHRPQQAQHWIASLKLDQMHHPPKHAENCSKIVCSFKLFHLPHRRLPKIHHCPLLDNLIHNCQYTIVRYIKINSSENCSVVDNCHSTDGIWPVPCPTASTTSDTVAMFLTFLVVTRLWIPELLTAHSCEISLTHCRVEPNSLKLKFWSSTFDLRLESKIILCPTTSTTKDTVAMFLTFLDFTCSSTPGTAHCTFW